MSPRYLAILGNGPPQLRPRVLDIAARCSRRGGFEKIVDTDGLVLLVDREDAFIRLGRQGAIVGTVFAKPEGGGRLKSLAEPAQKAILSTQGTSLVEDYWGSYVAVLNDAPSRSTHIVRDPSGMLPCYYSRHEHWTVVASDAGTLIDAEVFAAELDWTRVAHHLLHRDLRQASTCLNGLTELTGGFRLTVASDGWHTTPLWSPWHFASREEQIDDETSATNCIRDATLGCIASWASCFDRILLGLSGGLDSSIVAAGLHAAEADFSCLTLITRNPIGDERDFAHSVARMVDSPLIEAFDDLEKVDLERSDAAGLPRPMARAFSQSGDRILADAAAQTRSNAIFGGGGGDNVFCYMQSAALLADRLLVEGVGRGALRTARDLSRLARAPMWRAFAMAVRRAWFRGPGYRWPTDRSLLAPTALQCSEGGVDHPWLDAPAGALPGKAVHIAWILGYHSCLESCDDPMMPSRISPLVSQPLIEACLRIPTWLWCSEGRNRAVARAAFTDLLPPGIIGRRSKGTPDGFVIEVFEANRSRIREMLADGLLASRALLDRNAVLRLLATPRPPQGAELIRLMGLVDVEAWLRAWMSRTSASPFAGSLPAQVESMRIAPG